MGGDTARVTLKVGNNTVVPTQPAQSVAPSQRPSDIPGTIIISGAPGAGGTGGRGGRGGPGGEGRICHIPATDAKPGANGADGPDGTTRGPGRFVALAAPPIPTDSSLFTASPPEADSISALADRFAPQFMHPESEPNLPTSAEFHITRTTLLFHNADCPSDNQSFGAASVTLIRDTTVTSTCNGHVYRASGTRSASRSKTFVLNDVARDYQRGSLNPKEWPTYFHAFHNKGGGWSLQYWVFYPYNTGKKIGPLEVGFHGGDWEMVQVDLDKKNEPVSAHFTGHTSLEMVPWATLQTTNRTHPIVYTEKGGHEAHPVPVNAPAPYILHQTWSTGIAQWSVGGAHGVGPLINLGIRLHPQVAFVRYSGLWGSLGATPFSSGYWGPAFNETGMTGGRYLAAWCTGIDDPEQGEGMEKECYVSDPQ